MNLNEDKLEVLATDIANYALGVYVIGDGNITDDINFSEIMKGIDDEHFNALSRIKDFVKRRVIEELEGKL